MEYVDHLKDKSIDFYYYAFDTIEFTIPKNKSVHHISYPYESLVRAYDFISSMINKNLYEIFGCDVTCPIYKLNCKERFYGYDGLARSSEVQK